jgi:hypothetical protein
MILDPISKAIKIVEGDKIGSISFANYDGCSEKRE